MRLRNVLALALVPSFAVAAPNVQKEVDALAVPPPETATYATAVTLPSVPSFELPAPEPGFVDPRYLRVRGKKLLDTQVKVKGYIVWIYDCVVAVRKPKETKKQTQKRLDADPTLCERPKFYLATTRDTPPEKALWVVDVPRPPNKLEKERLPKADLAAWPAVPKFKLGDYVIITGDFKTASPHSERNSDGLIVFAAIESAKPPPAANSQPAAKSQPAAQPVLAQPPAKPTTKPASPPMRTKVDPKVVSTSMASVVSGNKSAAAKQFTDAMTEYKRAITAWDGNHLAWYGLGGAHAQSGDWQAAVDAFEHAVKLRPDAAMYQMWNGIAAYEATVTRARVDQAAKLSLKPEDIKPDLSAVVFDKARDSLSAAIALEPTLWRANYYFGRIYRDGDNVKLAAESFTHAIESNRGQPGPYIALGELYRKWDYTAEAIAVVQLGTNELPANAGTSDVFYVLGMAYDDQLDYKRAIEQFTRALELKPDNTKAQFQRGQVYYKLKKYKDAKADLEAFLAAAGPPLEFAKQQAQKFLMDIAALKK